MSEFTIWLDDLCDWRKRRFWGKRTIIFGTAAGIVTVLQTAEVWTGKWSVAAFGILTLLAVGFSRKATADLRRDVKAGDVRVVR